MSLAAVLTAIQSGTSQGEGRAAIIGALARNAWAPPRATTDIDMVVSASEPSLAGIQRELEHLGYRCVRRQQADAADSIPDVMIFRSDKAELRQVDLLVAKTAFEREVLDRATRLDISGISFPVATAEDLVVYKLIADRPRDREDIRAVVRTQARAGRGLDWTYIGRWAKYWGVEDRFNELKAQRDG